MQKKKMQKNLRIFFRIFLDGRSLHKKSGSLLDFFLDKNIQENFFMLKKWKKKFKKKNPEKNPKKNIRIFFQIFFRNLLDGRRS